MRIGVVFPQTELGGDVDAVRAYGEAVERARLHAPAGVRPRGRRRSRRCTQGWAGPYDITTTFHEPFVMFGYLAAVTALELVTGIIILPQRQTALVAKQAAEVDLLTERPLPARRRHRLERRSSTRRSARTSRPRPPHERADRAAAPAVDRAVGHLRRRPTSRSTGAGLAPLPVQRPIPIWIGGASDAGLPPHRAARRRLVPAGAARARPRRRTRRRRRQAAEDAGRDPPPSAWRAGSAAAPTSPSGSSARSTAGARPAPPTSPSTRCTTASAPWRTTWPPWPGRRSCSA